MISNYKGYIVLPDKGGAEEDLVGCLGFTGIRTRPTKIIQSAQAGTPALPG